MRTAFQEFNQVMGQLESVYHEAAVKMGLSDSEFWILYSLAIHEEGCCQSQLCRETGMTKTTVNSALKKMKRDGLLETAPGAGRTLRITLTPQGRDRAEHTVCPLIRRENQIYDSWPPEQTAALIRLNRDLAAQLSSLVKSL